MSASHLHSYESRTSIISTPTYLPQPLSLFHSVLLKRAHTVVISLLKKFLILFALDQLARSSSHSTVI